MVTVNMLKFGSKHDSNIVYKCTVRLLEDTEILECEYKPHHKGKYLLEYVCQQLNLIEQDYLGLRYVDNQDQRHWLDLGKSICKQVKDLDPVLFSFRVKFYPPDPFRLKEEITRYQIFLQLKRDLLHGRLYCGTNEASTLAALILQGELGDYDPEIHVGNYMSDMKLLLKQTEAIEEKAMEIHQKQLKGHSQSQVEHTFLKIACQLDTYGVDPHPVKDHKGSQLYLGINYSGILTFQGSRKTHHFRWPDIQKINYEGKMFIIHLNYNDVRQHGGACIFTQNDMDFEGMKVIQDMSSKAHVECACIKSWSIKTIVLCIYRTDLETRSISGEVVCTGYNLQQSIFDPTREAGSTSTFFDNIFINFYRVGGNSVLKWAISDHYAQILTYDAECEESDKTNESTCKRGGWKLLHLNYNRYVGMMYITVLRKNILLASNAHPDKLADMYGDVQLNKCCFSRYCSLPRSSHSDVGGSRMESSGSTGLLSGLDGNPSQPYSDVAALETVSEDQEAIGATKLRTTVLKDDSMDRFSDYYFRDSFEHSSSESQLIDSSYRGYDTTNPSHRSSRSQTPLSHSQVDGRICLPNTAHPLHNNTKKCKKFSVVGAFVPCLIIVIVFVFISTIVILETDNELLSSIRNIPEMISLRYQIYEPMKEYFRNKITILF